MLRDFPCWRRERSGRAAALSVSAVVVVHPLLTGDTHPEAEGQCCRSLMMTPVSWQGSILGKNACIYIGEKLNFIYYYSAVISKKIYTRTKILYLIIIFTVKLFFIFGFCQIIDFIFIDETRHAPGIEWHSCVCLHAWRSTWTPRGGTALLGLYSR